MSEVKGRNTEQMSPCLLTENKRTEGVGMGEQNVGLHRGYADGQWKKYRDRLIEEGFKEI